MRKLGGVALVAVAIVLAGCAGSPAPAPTVTVTQTAAPAPTVTVTATPTAAADPVPSAAPDARLEALRSVSLRVTGVEETEPGRWVVHTSIVDPRGDNGSSAAAQTALDLCEKAVELGASKVSVMESNDTSFVLYGHPSYGDVCTII